MVPDEYDILRESYSNILRQLVPKLTADRLPAAVEAVNDLVRLARPANWAMSDEPSIILGITSDRKMVAYSEGGTLGFYHGQAYESLHTRITGMLEKARREYDEGKPSPNPEILSEADLRRTRVNRLDHAHTLLEDLVRLRAK